MCTLVVLVFSPSFPASPYHWQCAEMSRQGHLGHVSIRLCQRDKGGEKGHWVVMLDNLSPAKINLGGINHSKGN